MEELEESKKVAEELESRHSAAAKELDAHQQVIANMRAVKNAEETKKEDLLFKNQDLKRKILEKRQGNS
jgi:hypothetical protein